MNAVLFVTVKEQTQCVRVNGMQRRCICVVFVQSDGRSGMKETDVVVAHLQGTCRKQVP
jgi:hypothetical protein